MEMLAEGMAVGPRLDVVFVEFNGGSNIRIALI